MAEAIKSIEKHFFINLVIFTVCNGIFLYYIIQNIIHIFKTFNDNYVGLSFWQNISKSTMPVLIIVIEVVAVVIFSRLIYRYTKDLPYVLRKEYASMTAVVVYADPRGDSGGRTISFKNVETEELIKINSQNEKPEQGETVTVYYLPNTRIGRWI